MPSSNITTHHDSGTLTITINGHFTYELSHDFRDVYEKSTDIDTYILNFKNVINIDSAALGRMMVLYNHAQSHGATVKIVHASPEVIKVLRIVQYHKLFQME